MYKTHGFSRVRGGNPSAEYKTWQSLLQRCYNEKCPSHVNYGSRGISVCDRWRESFTNFLADVGIRPSPKHSLDRRDNEGNYEPNNCRWVTSTEQNLNHRGNHRLEHKGERLTITEWAQRTGISRDRIFWRIRKGWSAERALTTPARPWNRLSSPALIAQIKPQL